MNQVTGHVFLLDVKKKKWLQAPSPSQLTQPRIGHSSCATKTSAFVFGGQCSDRSYSNTFEQLSWSESERGEGGIALQLWTLTEIPGFIPRLEPLMFAISDYSVLILGGFNNKEGMLL